MAAVTSASGSMYLQSPPPPPPEIPPIKKAKVEVEVEVEEEGPEGYSVFEGKYDYGDSDFSDLDSVEEEEDWLYILYVDYYDDGDKPREKISAYTKQIAESEGFDIDDSPDAFIGSIRPLDKEALHNDKDLMECLNYAIAENNANSEKPYLDLVSVKKANYLGCAGFIYYITFVAKHVDLGKNFTFQAKVYSGLGEHKEVLIFRPLYKPSGVKWTREDACST